MSKPEELCPTAAQQQGEPPFQPPVELLPHKQRRFELRKNSEEESGTPHPKQRAVLLLKAGAPTHITLGSWELQT